MASQSETTPLRPALPSYPSRSSVRIIDMAGVIPEPPVMNTSG